MTLAGLKGLPLTQTDALGKRVCNTRIPGYVHLASFILYGSVNGCSVKIIH